MKIEDIFESFNFTTTIQWLTNTIAEFKINEHKFQVELRPARIEELQTLQPFFADYEKMKVANLSFSALLPDGTQTQDITGLMGGLSMKVFAVVAQAANQKINEYDIVLAMSKQQMSPTNYNSRVSAYERIISILAHRAGLNSLRLVKTKTFCTFAVFKYTLLQGMISIKNHLDNYYKDKE